MSESENGTQPEIETAAIAADTTTPSETAEAQATTETTETEAATTQPDEPKRRPWFEKVIADKSFEARENKRQVEALQAQLQALQRSPQSPQQQNPVDMVPRAELERLVEARATEQHFVDSCNAVADTGASKYPDFKEAVDNYGLLGGPPPAFLEAITALGKDDGAKVYYDLGKNPDEAARILALPPVKMAMALAKMASAPAKAIAVSKAPTPISPISSSATARAGAEPDAKDMVAWNQWFLKQRNAPRS